MSEATVVVAPVVDQRAEAIQKYEQTFDQLEALLGENKRYAPQFVRAALVADRTVEQVLNALDIPVEQLAQKREMIIRAGVVTAIGDSPVAKSLDGPDYHKRVNEIAGLAVETWKADEAVPRT
jgi:hypothetical protein